MSSPSKAYSKVGQSDEGAVKPTGIQVEERSLEGITSLSPGVLSYSRGTGAALVRHIFTWYLFISRGLGLKAISDCLESFKCNSGEI